MKLSKNWKRIIAGFMAFTLVFLSVDAGCVSALAAEIQEWNNEKEIMESFPTGGLMQIKGMEVSLDEQNRANADVKLSALQLSEEDTYDWEKFSTKYVYNQLSPEWKDIWDDMDELCLLYLNTNVDGVVSYDYFSQKDYYFTTAIPIVHEITSADFYTLYSLFLASNPQYYFLGYSGFEYVFANDDNYIDSVGLGIYQAFLDGDTRLSVTNSFQTVIEEAYAGLSENATEAEILRHLHDYVVGNVEYNHEVLKDDNTITDEEEADNYTQSAYSALCMDTTVCAGYAEALQLLCNGLDVDALIVTSSDHMWNKVRINDSWYNVDPTWADNGMTDGENNPIYYGYYGRSDTFYHETDTNPNASSHVEEAIWNDYLPDCIQDTNPSGYYEPGLFYVPTETLPAPTIKVEKNETETYNVSISMDENYSGAAIYYTLDGTEPSAASTKSYIYKDSFTVNPETVIRAIAVADGYYDSPIAEKEAVMVIDNPVIQSHFYQKLTFAWDALGSQVDGYVIHVYNGTDFSQIGDAIDISGGETGHYFYDTKDLAVGVSVYYEIYGYTLDEEQNKVIATEKSVSAKCVTNLLKEPLDVDVKWHVTTSEGLNYLVINVEGSTQEKLSLWYFTDENGVEFVNNYTLDMTDGVTEFKYSFDKHKIAYDKVGYVYITDELKATAFQENGFAVGGKYNEPALAPIEDVELKSTGETVELETVIEADTQMQNFNYKYQWYVSEDSTSKGTAIDGATDSKYTVQIGSFDEKYYYCEVTAEYMTKYVFVTSNGETHTRVEGALFDKEITYEPIENQTYTGDALEPAPVIKNELGETLVLGRDYKVSYVNNINAGQATINVEFIGVYEGEIEDATIYFTIAPKTATQQSLQFTDVVSGKEYIYTGTSYKPSMTVFDSARGENLVENTDYTIAYGDNVNAGTATITMKFMGNYDGIVVINFEIQAKDANNADVAAIEDQTFTGQAIIPELYIKVDEKELVVNKDYEITCVKNIHVGVAGVTINFIGNYKGTKSAEFEIVPRNASEVSITAIDNQEYTGLEIEPVLDVVYRNGDFVTVLTKETNYTVAYSNNTELGTAKITLTFKGDFTGTREVEFEIVARNAENLSYGEMESFVYTGEAFTPALTIKNGGILLEVGKDYIVEYSDNVNAGTGKVKAIFEGFEGCSGNYAGEKELTFQIKPKSAINCKVTLEIADEGYTYTGKAIEPGVVVMDGEVKLTEETDYTVSYTNNIDAGEATVTITYKGNYEGAASQTFMIERKPITTDDIEIETIEDQIYNGTEIIPEIGVKDKNTGNVLKKDFDYTVAGTNNVFVGTANLVIRLNLTGNYIYTGDDIHTTFEIVARDSANVEISAIPEQKYTGSAITPALEVKDGEIVLVAGRDYTVEYENNVEVGTEAKVIVHFIGNFAGESKIAYFTIIDPVPEYITSSVFSINQTNGYISKITVGTTVYSLWSSINERDYVAVFDKKGSTLSGESILATGMTAGIMDDGAVTKRYTIIVTGDTNGDGKINITDMIAVKACTLKKSDLTGAYEKAGDVNGDGKINITDFIKVKATTLKKDTITGVSVY